MADDAESLTLSLLVVCRAVSRNFLLTLSELNFLTGAAVPEALGRVEEVVEDGEASREGVAELGAAGGRLEAGVGVGLWMIGGGTAGDDSDAPSVGGTGAGSVVTVGGDVASVGGMTSLGACCAGGSTGAGTSDGPASFSPELASPSFVCVVGSNVRFAASRDGPVMAAGAWSSEGVAWSAAADGGGGGGEEDIDLV